MPIQTDLNVSPYFDDYNEKDDYYKILFRPGVAVQVRELNQLQTILQKQVERFGDNIYKRGTIIDGCNFIFHNPLPYIKINDVETDGTPINVSAFKGYLARNTANLVAQIIETETGFEATAPDLNTLFVKYLNNGSNGRTTSFDVNQVLTIFDPSLPVADIDINVKSSGFSNSDTTVFLSAITVENTTGGQDFVNATGQACTFTVGEVITQAVTGARAEVRQINATANGDSLILKIRPLASELRIGNSASWSFLEGYQFTSTTSSITANLVNLIGSGATGSIVTDATGGVITAIVIDGGSGYYVEPYVTVAYNTPNTSSSANSLIDALNMTAKNYKALAVVNSSPTSIGNGYGFSVSDGIIYQKGYFSRISETFIVVEKYSAFTNNVVGFDTLEEIVDFKTDNNLYDNATGTFNINAPGANRLKLTPTLVVLTTEEAEANDQFFSIVEFSEGRPFKQHKTTQFNTINKQLAQRTAEESGDYVIDQFLVSTNGQESFEDEAQFFEVAIDPGLAYINGYRVETMTSYYKDLRKGTNTFTTEASLSINYGNYIKVKELGGLFKFSVGALVSLRDTAKNYLTTSSAAGAFAAITAAGTEIGTARIRSLVLVSGNAGSPDAVYYMYVFDIKMDTGKNFKNVRSVYYDGAGLDDGIADIELDGGIAIVYDPKSSTLLYPSGAKALKNANNVSYTYRTVNDTVTCGTDGTMSLSIAQNPGEYFPYNATLSDLEKLSLIAIPLANAVTANATGSVAIAAGNSTVTGTSTSFVTVFEVGDYVRIANASTSNIKRIASIANATSLKLDSVISSGFTTANIALAFPQYAPIPLYLRDERTVSVTSNTTLTINLGNTFATTTAMAVVYNAQRVVNATPKSVVRQAYVKIDTATNAANNTGPWSLGIPDIIRLRNVYAGNSTAVTASDTNITDNFWIDHNQKKDYYDVGYLFKKPGYNLSSSVYILVEFDALTVTQEGLKTLTSYPIDDTISFANSVSTINTLEIPELIHDDDEYIDLRDAFDFRPYTLNTATITNVAADATVNPTESLQATRFDVINDKKFPAPQSDCTALLENYLGRIDAVIINSNSDFRVIEGVASIEPKTPSVPDEGLLLNFLIIPPYPSLPRKNSADTNLFLNKKIANMLFTTRRQKEYRITTPIDPQGLKYSQPKRYTMKEIGELERRISDLEYYTALSATEDTINNLQIASSSNSAINRFKFGFFVDNFTTSNFAETSDPTYNAQIYGYQLQPAKQQFKIGYKFNINDNVTASSIVGDKVLLPATRKALIKQSLATEATTVDVAVTQTVFTTTGTQVQTTTTNVVKVPITTLNQASAAQRIPFTKTIADTNGAITPVTGQLQSNWVGAPFEVGKLAGTITANGGKQKSAPQMQLQRYLNGVWQTVAFSIGSQAITLTFNYTPNSAGTDRLFRIKGGGGGSDTNLFGGSYPRSKDVIEYQNKTSTTTDPQTTIETKTEVLTTSTIVEKTTSIVSPLFTSKLSGALTMENLFNPPSNIDSPFIDLASYIQDEVNNFTD